MKITFNTLNDYSKINKSSKNKKIGIFIGGKTDYYSASSYIRLLSPLDELSSDYTICIIDDNSHTQFNNDLKNNNIQLDTLIIQRDIFDRLSINLEFIKQLYDNLKRNNVKIIFDIDDDLLNIDKTHPSYEKYLNLKPIIKFMINNSNIISVSTDTLKNKLIEYNPIIVPNTLIKNWNFNPNAKIKNLNNKNVIKIGYFGTFTHNNDLKLVEHSLINVKKYFTDKNIILEVIGISNENYDWIKKINIPITYSKNPSIKDQLKNFVGYFLKKINLTKKELPYCNFIDWVKNEMDWDIAIAPLEQTNINDSKSNLKYLEYTALNIPGIYSNIGPYKEIDEKNTGIVVNNTIEEWEKALINLIKDPKLYKTILINAHNDISKNYLVKNSSIVWNEILNE